MIKKIVASLLAVPAAYLAYCLTRGVIYGIRHDEPATDELCYKIATFRA
jgi:hypothetical protein